jgi:C_GCAxxG_C_C family probable redox protein
MSAKCEKAAELFSSNFNCAQSVFAVFCEDYGMDIETGLKVAGAFGGGLRCGEICGAVSGGAMVVGLKYGQTSSEDLDAKAECNMKTIEFTDVFKEKFGSLICREFLGYDVRDAEAREQNRHKHTEVCLKLVQGAVQLLEDLGY